MNGLLVEHAEGQPEGDKEGVEKRKVSSQVPTGCVGVCEDSEIDVNEPVVVPSAEPVSGSKELSGCGCL